MRCQDEDRKVMGYENKGGKKYRDMRMREGRNRGKVEGEVKINSRR